MDETGGLDALTFDDLKRNFAEIEPRLSENQAPSRCGL